MRGSYIYSSLRAVPPNIEGLKIKQHKNCIETIEIYNVEHTVSVLGQDGWYNPSYSTTKHVWTKDTKKKIEFSFRFNWNYIFIRFGEVNIWAYPTLDSFELCEHMSISALCACLFT